MPVAKLKEFLDKKKVKFVSIRHSTAYTAQEIAASAHVKGRNLAKSVVVKLDGKMALAVLPAKYQIDFDKLRGAAKAKKVELAEEEEFAQTFPGCETGAQGTGPRQSPVSPHQARHGAKAAHHCQDGC